MASLDSPEFLRSRVSDYWITIISLLITVAYHLLTMSWPWMKGHLTYCDRLDPNTQSQIASWCGSIHPINERFYYGGNVVLNGIVLQLYGNSVGIVLSKLLGAGRQGTVQGFTQFMVCVAKIVGSLLLTYLFDQFGPQPDWLLQLGFLGLLLVLWIAYRRRLCP
uniref:MFS domain-containing protein n=1 Tax=Steinernema glaseri TaxID=37863 RepID=A0A1I7YMG3_9BILA